MGSAFLFVEMGSAFLFLLLIPAIVTVASDTDNISVTKVYNAYQKGVVCLDGSPAAYFYAAGSGDGVSNWIVFLMGGGWCANENACQEYKKLFSTANLTTQSFVGWLSSNKTVNPDFYNWNRVYIYYCDGASFLGDSQDLELALKFRSSVIFGAVIDELLQKGLRSATNAILVGSSIGGLACMLHSDEFRAYLPNTARVICVSDSGFFIHGENLPNPIDRERPFADVISFYKLTSFLSLSCTSKLDPSLCLFPEYFVRAIKTPLFILNSVFDSYQVGCCAQKEPEKITD